MHIAYVLPGLSIGGGVNVVLEHAERLVTRGHQVTVLSTESEPRVTWRTAHGIRLVSIHDFQEVSRALRVVPDVMVATGWQTVLEISWRRLPARSYGYFVQAHEPDFYEPDTYDADLAASTYTLPFSYLSEAQWLVEKLSGTYGHSVTYARNGLNDHFHVPATPIGARGDRFRILLEGPLGNPRKRMDDAFLAVQGLDAEIWLVTSGGELAPWQKPDRVFRDVPLKLMPSIYASCHAMVKLSSVEGMFGPPLEIMSQAGVPVTSDVEGHDEFMRDGENGFVVPVGDWSGARDALQRLMDEPGLWKELSDQAARTADGFRWEPSIDIVESWLEQTARLQPPDTGTQIFRLARLATRVYMSRAWQVESLDGRQLLHARLNYERAETSPAKWALQLLNGWVAGGSLSDRWSAAAPKASVLLTETWTDRPDVPEAVPEFVAAAGFDLAVLMPVESVGKAKVSLISETESEAVTMLDTSAVRRRSRGRNFTLDAHRAVECLSVERPTGGRTDVHLEIWGGTVGDEPPRAYVSRLDDDGEAVHDEITLTVSAASEREPVWVAEGLTLQRFLGDPRARLLVAQLGFTADLRWIDA